tara:strand:- start:1113 stop:1259 length:147 start_codon:yes stop_codon:yes gene_type:complete
VLARNKWLSIFFDINMEHHGIAADWTIFNIVLVKSFSYVNWDDYFFTA